MTWYFGIPIVHYVHRTNRHNKIRSDHQAQPSSFAIFSKYQHYNGQHLGIIATTEMATFDQIALPHKHQKSISDGSRSDGEDTVNPTKSLNSVVAGDVISDRNSDVDVMADMIQDWAVPNPFVPNITSLALRRWWWFVAFMAINVMIMMALMVQFGNQHSAELYKLLCVQNEMQCNSCKGKGDFTCSVCGGDGEEIDCDHGAPGAKSCGSCNATGRLPCMMCRGKGTIVKANQTEKGSKHSGSKT